MRLKILYSFLLIILCFACRKLPNERVTAITTDVVVVSNTLITANATLVDLGEISVLDHGFCFSLNPTPTTNDNVISLKSKTETGTFQTILHNLQANKTYYIRAFVSDGSKMYYGTEKSFKTQTTGLNIVNNKPTITSTSSITISGSISNLGSLTLLSFGQCWSITNPPSITSDKTSFGTIATDTTIKTDVYNIAIDTKYYFRTYAQVDENTILYSTLDSVLIPKLALTTDAYSLTDATTATLQGTIIEKGVSNITDHGFCWSITSATPNYNNNKISLGTMESSGSFYSSFTNLQKSTTYYFRAYATDGIYVYYGTIKTITIQ